MGINSDQGGRIQKWMGYILGGIAFLMILYHFYYITHLPFEPSQHAIVHLGFASVIMILFRLRQRFQVTYILMLAATLCVNLYFFTHYDEILSNPSYPPNIALVAGALSAVIVFILTVEVFGWIFPILTAIAVLYTAFGSYLPSLIKAPPVDLQRLITLMSADVTSPWGVYGSLLILSANYLFLFIFFGSVLEAFGGLRFIMSIGSLAASKFRSGAAALSVFTSALLGSLTGSTVANITITGSFTIPMMKKTGYTPEHAAAIETAASSGGQILPPVMGATVFVMSGYTGIPYFSIVKVSFIPAIIYFAIVLLYVELNARKLNIAPMPLQKINMKSLLFDGPVFIVPLLLLLILLMQGRSLMFTIFWSLICVVILGLLSGTRKGARLNWDKMKNRLMDGIISGSQIAIVLALIGIIVGTVEVTGLGMRLGKVLLLLCHDNLFLLLIITALTSMILGVGVPTPAAYIICATILSPAMIKLGVPLLQAHLFPLYYAVFAHLTPPVAIGLMVACKMAEAKYWSAAREALKVALASFLFPFFFVYSPAILLEFESFSSGVQQFLAILLSFFTVSIALNKYWSTRLNLAQHAILIGAALASLISIFAVKSYYFLIIGGLLGIVGIALNIRMSKKGMASKSHIFTGVALK
ncbi:MAG: TRAP transporter fused permease subunit [Proteobacteria bacterium]|nr:TRAP transporter fused permease subunit [Pseudomonadota bacterium]